MEISKGNAFLQCEGRVLYCLKGDNESTAPYNIGMEFIAMSEEDKEKLKEFIRSMDDEGSDSSSFVRIQGT